MSRPIGIPCRLCLGRCHILNGPACDQCRATGWIVKPLDQLSPEEATELRREIQEIPPDGETAYQTQSVRENLTQLLTRCWIESITFPTDDNTHIILHGKKSDIQLFPEFLAGKFIGINAIPLAEPPLPPTPKIPA